MDPLRDLWGDTGGDGGKDGDGAADKDKARNVVDKRSFAQVVNSTSSGDSRSSTGAGKLGDSKRMSKALQSGVKLTGAKRPRSPKVSSCGRCFRSTHTTADCRHQIVCMKCACVGHMAARCPIGRSPNRKRLHVRSKKLGSATGEGVQHPGGQHPGQQFGDPVVGRASHASLSISLTPAIEKLREDLAKVAVLSLVEGYVNESSVLEVAPTIINSTLAGPITPLNDCSFLIPLANREEVREVCKLGSFKVATKDGPCTLKLSPWSAEIGADGRASGSGQWVNIWNLPLHGWCWDTISDVVKPIGELVALSHATIPHKRFLTVLVRRRAGTSLPFELDLSMGMRRYSVLLTGERELLPIFRRELGRYVLPDPRGSIDRQERKATHEIPAKDKGKQHIDAGIDMVSKRSLSIELVEPGSRPVDRAGVVTGDKVIDVGKSVAECMVEPSSQDAGDSVHQSKKSVKDVGRLKRSVVELCSHDGSPTGLPRSPAKCVRTDGPSIGHARTDGIDCARISERRRSHHSAGRTLHETRQRRVEFWKAKTKKVRNGEIGDSEVLSECKHVRILGEVDRSLDPITLVGSDVQMGLVNQESESVCDPLLLCEVGCFVGRQSPTENRGRSSKVAGPNDLSGPSGDHGSVNLQSSKEYGLGLVTGCDKQKGSFDVREMMANTIGPGQVDGLEFGPKFKEPGVDDGFGDGLDISFNTKAVIPIDLKNINFKDEEAMPDLVPPVGFAWDFIAGGWALRPSVGQVTVTSVVEPMEAPIEQNKVHSPSVIIASSDSTYESDESISEFEKNLRDLLPDLPGGSDRALSTRRSERKKKPSSRFTEEAGYVAEPPRSTKKKAIRGDIGEGTSSKPCLISDWNDVQLVKFCDACGISFTHSENACLNHIRHLEQSHLAPSRDLASSYEDRVNTSCP